MSTPYPMSGPGVILTFFKLREPPRLSPETLEEWFEKEFAPGMLATGAVKTAWLYEAADPGYDKQQLMIYKIPDLAQAGKLREVDRTSKLSLFEGTVDEYIEMDSRMYSMVQMYETTKREAGRLRSPEGLFYFLY